MSTVDSTVHDNFEDEVEESGHKMLMFNVIPSWMVSFVLHAGLIVLLAILVMPKKEELDTALKAVSTSTESVETIDLDMAEFEDSEMEEVTEEFDEVTPIEVETFAELETMDTLENSEFVGVESMVFDDSDMGDLGAMSGSSSEVGGRTGESKKKALKEYGGSDATEEAVQLALKWIVNHQLPDGGWNFDHRAGPGTHRDSPNPGSMEQARLAATAMALLPLLGNGQTHKVGTYKDNVKAGLEFLMANARPSGRGISFWEKGSGTMYSHGLCAIVFCEAFAMTKDPKLAPYAQGTIWFIEDAQDPVGGGWKYQPRERGDTSVVGWQVMALKSAKLSGLNINPRTWRLVDKFLNGVSNTNGAYYAYQAPPNGNKGGYGQTAIGLLCRMYMGWDKDTPGLKEGCEWLSTVGSNLQKTGPESGDMYYVYYGTQLMKQYGGPQWAKWNAETRDTLVNSQSKSGNSAGSWFFSFGHGPEKGGRLYNTSLACMTLEVYYRYLPIYTDKSVTDDFKLE